MAFRAGISWAFTNNDATLLSNWFLFEQKKRSGIRGMFISSGARKLNLSLHTLNIFFHSFQADVFRFIVPKTPQIELVKWIATQMDSLFSLFIKVFLFYSSPTLQGIWVMKTLFAQMQQKIGSIRSEKNHGCKVKIRSFKARQLSRLLDALP